MNNLVFLDTTCTFDVQGSYTRKFYFLYNGQNYRLNIDVKNRMFDDGDIINSKMFSYCETFEPYEEELKNFIVPQNTNFSNGICTKELYYSVEEVI